MRKIRFLSLLILLYACKDNRYYCEKIVGPYNELYVLYGRNDRLEKIRSEKEYQFSNDIKYEYLEAFDQNFAPFLNDYQRTGRVFKYAKWFYPESDYSLVKTVNSLESKYYYCYRDDD